MARAQTSPAKTRTTTRRGQSPGPQIKPSLSRSTSRGRKAAATKSSPAKKTASSRSASRSQSRTASTPQKSKAAPAASRAVTKANKTKLSIVPRNDSSDDNKEEVKKEEVSVVKRRGASNRKAKEDANAAAVLSVQPSQQPQSQPQQQSPPQSPQQQQQQTHVFKATIAVIFYFITSIATVLLNKFLLDGELKKSAAFITWVQIVFSVVVTYTVSFIMSLFSSSSSSSSSSPSPSQSGESKQTQSVESTTTTTTTESPLTALLRSLIQTLPAGVIFCLMLILNNLCLAHVHVAFYQVARSWTILMSIILSYYFFGDKASTKQLICCAIVVLGYVSACEGELPWSQLYLELQALVAQLVLYLKFYLNPTALTPAEVTQLASLASDLTTASVSSSPSAHAAVKSTGSILLGLIFGFFSCFMVAYNAILTKKLQRSTSLTRAQLIGAVNLNCAIILFVYLWFSGEWASTLANPALYNINNLVPLLVVSLSGHLLGFATQMQIQYTSALGHNVSGTAKASVQSVIAWYMEPKPITALTIVGTAATILGCGAYAMVGGPQPPTPQPTTTVHNGKKH